MKKCGITGGKASSEKKFADSRPLDNAYVCPCRKYGVPMRHGSLIVDNTSPSCAQR